MSITLLKTLKNLFQLSFFTLLLAASSVVLSVEQQQSFSQLPYQDNNNNNNNSAAEPTGFLTYQNTTYGITMQYPSDWQLSEGITSSGGPSIGFVSQFEGPSDIYPEMFWIGIDNLENTNVTLSGELEKTIDEQKNKFPDFTLIESDTNSNIAGYPAYKFVFTYTEGVESGNCKEVCDQKALFMGTIIDNKKYSIEYYGEEAKYDTYIPIIQEMMNSIQLSGTSVTDAQTADDGLGDDTDNSAAEPTGFLTYQNTTYGITMQYPSDWRVDTTDFPGDPLIQIVGFYSTLESRVDPYEERLWIAQERQSFSQDIDLVQYAEQVLSNYNSTLTDFTLVEIDTETARLGNNNSPAYRIVYTDRLQPENIELKTMEIGTIIGDKIYVVTYYAEATKYDQYLPTIEEMINSIELSGTSVTDASTADDDLGDDGGGTVIAENQTGGISTDQGNNNGTTQQGSDVDFLRYETSFEEETLSIDYPSGWEVFEYEQDPSATYHQIAGFYSPRLSITDPFPEFVGISVEELNENMTLDQYFEYTIAAYSGSESIPSSQVISSSDEVFLTSKNYPAYQVEYTMWDDEVDRQLRIIEVGTIVEDKAYMLSYFGDDNNGFSQFLPIAQQMIDSFEINEAKRTRGVAGTLPDPGSQYLELSYDEWRSDNINVMILVNPDTEEQSSKYVDEVESAINSWSQALKDYSGNSNAWNFNVSTSVSYVGSAEIGPGQEADLVIELTGDPEGVSCTNIYGVAMAHPYELTIPATVHVLTSCLDAETGGGLTEFPEEVVYSTALHEFAHALGLGHAFNINNDLMCSAEADINGNSIPTCEYYEPDVQEISEADVAALIYKYGVDGFEPPNTELRGPVPFYEVGTPIEVAVNGTGP